MPAKVDYSVDRYILQAFLKQVGRVFGVQPHFTLRSDFSDVLPKITAKNSDRTTGLCFVRPIGFTLKRDGYRANAVTGRGQKGSIAQTRMVDGAATPSHYNVLHPVPSTFRYDVTFTVNAYTEMARLWTIWAQCALQNSLSFRINYQDVFYDVSCELAEDLAVPESGQRGQEREDMMRLFGEISVHGYTSVVSDPHVVPVILFPETETGVET